MLIDDATRRDLIDIIQKFLKPKDKYMRTAEDTIKARDLKWRLENEKGSRKKQGRSI